MQSRSHWIPRIKPNVELSSFKDIICKLWCIYVLELRQQHCRKLKYWNFSMIFKMIKLTSSDWFGYSNTTSLTWNIQAFICNWLFTLKLIDTQLTSYNMTYKKNSFTAFLCFLKCSLAISKLFISLLSFKID